MENYADEGCRRSVDAYPVLFRRSSPSLPLRFEACTGAESPQVRALQLGALSDATRVVTFDDRKATMPAIDGLRPALRATYDAIRARDARVFVLGYPRLFVPQLCTDAALTISTGEQRELNGLADVVRSEVEGRPNFAFIDPRDAFADHHICARESWIRGVSGDTQEGYHPNASGHAAYARLLDARC